MKIRLILLILLLGFTTDGISSAQDPLGPQPKRARTREDYTPRTLEQVAAMPFSSDKRGDKRETLTVDPDLAPSRVRVRYGGLTRRIPERQREVINQWARLYAGAPETYRAFEVDVLFTENEQRSWLTFRKDKLELFWKALRGRLPVDLFIIRMGAAKVSDRWEPVLLVEDFEQVEPKQ